MSKFRPSFTLLEVVVTITVTAIIMGSTFNLLMNIYNSYRDMRDLRSVDEVVSTASLQLIKYLEHRIDGSKIESNGTTFKLIYESDLLSGDTSLQWISRGFDSFNGVWSNDLNAVVPTWSGFLDLSLEHNRSILFLDETNITGAKEIIWNLSNGEVNIFNATISSSPVLFFKGNLYPSNDGFGWKSIEGNLSGKKFAYLGSFNENNYTSFGEFNDTITEDSVLRVYEQYLLSWTAYGVKLEGSDLYLYYNYRPWNGDVMESDGTKILLLKNVTYFNYKTLDASGSTIQIRVCASEDIDRNETIFCRDSSIF